jgi:hypothetical protein
MSILTTMASRSLFCIWLRVKELPLGYFSSRLEQVDFALKEKEKSKKAGQNSNMINVVEKLTQIEMNLKVTF